MDLFYTRKKANICLKIILLVLLFVNGSYSYFLSFKQKGELLYYGYVSDEEGNLFNVRIVPGYKSSFTYARNSWSSGYKNEKDGLVRFGKGLKKMPVSIKHFKYYFTSEPYRGIADSYSQAYDAEKYLYKNFMGKDLVGAWHNYFELARTAHNKKSFGWWFAYPWAFTKGTVNSSLRIVTGLPASFLVLTYPTVLRPTYEFTKPVFLTTRDILHNSFQSVGGIIQFTWGFAGEQIVEGTLIPFTSQTWTTAVGIPMGLVGREPTIESEDGWWVVLLPESPAYSKKVALRVKEMPVSFPKIIEYARKDFEFEEKLEPHLQNRNKKLEKLEAEINEVKNSYVHTKDSLQKAILDPLGEKNIYPVNYMLKENEEIYVRDVVIKYLEQDDAFLKLTESDRAELVKYIVTYYGKYILARPRAEFINPYSKTTPGTIIEEEVEEIINNK